MQTKIRIAVLVALAVIGAVYFYFNPEFRQAFKREYDKEFNKKFRPNFVKSCQNGDLSPHRLAVCECCADEIAAQFTVKELKTWTSPDKVDRVRTESIISACEEKNPDLLADAPDFGKLAREMNAPNASPAETTATQASESSQTSGPTPEKASDTIYLKNGQIVKCHILKKDENGITADIGGLEVSFTNDEISRIEQKAE